MIAAIAFPAHAETAPEPRPLPRVVLALYDRAQSRDVRDTRIHRLLEMPLNHLGLVVRYQDVNGALPPPEQLEDVRGIVTWFQADTMAHPVTFLKWAERMIDSGKRFVVMGYLGAGKDGQGRTTPVTLVNEFYARLGLRVENWTSVTYDQRVVYRDPAMIGFERPLPFPLPSFDRMRIVDSQVRGHLAVGRRNGDRADDAPLVVTGPHGGWIEVGYTHFASNSQDRFQWYINPFEFLRLALATDDLPKPDTTTLSGRRIYYSQIDGDGWRNLTEVAKYRDDSLMASEVVLREAIEPFADLPVTVGPIAADLDGDWFGTRESLAIAKKIFSLPWVEAGSHTYSHPLDWETLYQLPGPPRVRERPALTLISDWLNPSNWTAVNRAVERYSRPEADEGKTTLRRGQVVLRSYSLYPFDPDLEIGGSIAFLNRLLPPGKHVAIMQWSGTTLVSERVLRATRQAGVRNINGGDTRFDPEFSSYAWVAPLSRQVGALRQIYSSDSNENTYTNSWNERYFGFRYLTETLRRTESPVRVKPVDIYYHMYSGEKQPGIDAVRENLNYVRTQQLAPITASRYAGIVEGFHSLKIVPAGSRAWRIENRDCLDTLRFDRADRDWIDWRASKGVVGQRHYQGSLYVALDEADRSPVVALVSARAAPVADRPWLIQSRWRVSNLRLGATGFEFETQGFGAGEMDWSTPPNTDYEVEIHRASRLTGRIRASSSHDGTLRFIVSQTGVDPLAITVERSRGGT
jgi:hypothetical protein